MEAIKPVAYLLFFVPFIIFLATYPIYYKQGSLAYNKTFYVEIPKMLNSTGNFNWTVYNWTLSLYEPEIKEAYKKAYATIRAGTLMIVSACLIADLIFLFFAKCKF